MLDLLRFQYKEYDQGIFDRSFHSKSNTKAAL